MNFLHIVLLVKIVLATDIKITGEVAFDLKISNLDLRQGFEQLREYGVMSRGSDPGPNNMTAAPLVECVYQYPEQKQIDAMLSNMMNQLTKVFARVHDFLKRSNHRRTHFTRFTVVEKRNASFFEDIYNNMRQEYKDFYNSTSFRVDRSSRDPCPHQDEIKHIWLALLDASSLAMLRASRRCVDEVLKDLTSTENPFKQILDDFLARKVGKIRSKLLIMLCDTFQLCYNELM